MPIADKREDQDQNRDDQQTGRFQGVDLRRAMVLRRGLVRLPLWTRRRHTNIVALECEPA